MRRWIEQVGRWVVAVDRVGVASTSNGERSDECDWALGDCGLGTAVLGTLESGAGRHSLLRCSHLKFSFVRVRSRLFSLQASRASNANSQSDSRRRPVRTDWKQPQQAATLQQEPGLASKQRSNMPPQRRKARPWPIRVCPPGPPTCAKSPGCDSACTSSKSPLRFEVLGPCLRSNNSALLPALVLAVQLFYPSAVRGVVRGECTGWSEAIHVESTRIQVLSMYIIR